MGVVLHGEGRQRNDYYRSSTRVLMDEYLTFLSSPGDVKTERDCAERVINRLNSERVDQAQFKLERWEDAYYSATDDFQGQIVKPADCQIVICIFWQHLGTELSAKYRRADGSIPTGTEYEFYNALEAANSRPEKLPDILVYRKTGPVQLPSQLDEPEKYALESANYARFGAFWRRWFRSEQGQFLAAFEHFSDTEDFASKLEKSLRSWLRERKSEIVWNEGSPYRGLEPFDVKHARIFFGRRREVERTRARLIATTVAGKPFLLISGASGTGKSSLARAGLIPRLRQVGGLSTVASSLRWAIVNTGQLSGDWAGGVARALFAKEAVGDELRQSDFRTPEDLSDQLPLTTSAAVLPIVNALKRAGDVLGGAAGDETSPVVLLMLLDQLEELFTWPKTEAEGFLRLIKIMNDHPGKRIMLVATMRSDFLHRVSEFPLLQELMGRTEVKAPEEPERTLELGFPSVADLREMVTKPAEAAGLHFEVSADNQRDLVRLIERDLRPEAMPAIQLLLNELYNRKDGDKLTLKAYDLLEGVTGVMAKLGEEAFAAAGPAAQAAFPKVVRALVSQVSADAPAIARRIPEATFSGDPAATALLEKLEQASLIVTEQGELRFAHESILTGWTLLKDQISKERRLFISRELLERLCSEWRDPETGKKQSSRLLEGFPLAEGRQLAADWDEKSLAGKQPDLPAFIAASIRRDKWKSAGKYAAVATGVTLLAVSAYIFDNLRRTRIEAQAASDMARSRADLRDGNVISAVDFARRAFQVLPSDQSRSTLAATLLDVSPHLFATFDVGVEVRPVIEWIDDNALAYVPVSGAEIRTLDTGASRTNTQAPRFALPELIRKSDGNRAGIVAMRALSAKRVMVVYDEGTLAVLDGAAAPRLHGMQTGTLSAAHSVSIGARGGLIVSVNQDDGIVVATECPVEPSQAAPGCTNRTVAGVNGKVVAVSPDEKRFVVGDQSGSITIYDRDGSPIGGPLAIGGLPGAIAWGAKDQLAVATRADITQPSKIVRLQIGPAGTETKETTTGEASMLAWSGDGNALAFGCGKAVCLWLSRSTADGAVEFGQVRRLLGHDAAVTGVGWSRDGSRLASLSPDGIRIWTVNQNRDVSFALYAEAPARLSKVAVSRDGKWVAAGAGDGTLRIWDSASTELKRKETLGDASVESLAWTKAGAVAACLDDGTITIVSPDGAQAVQKLDDAQCETRIAFVDSDRSIATPRRGSKEVALIPIGEPTARKEQTVGSFGAVPSGLAWDEGLIRLFVACDDGLPRAVDVAGKSVRTMTPTAIPDNRGAGSLSVSADGKWLATSGGDRYVRIYAIAANAGAETLVMEQDEPNVVAFNTDATRLAALGTRNRLYVWTRAAGTSERFAIVDVDLARPLVAEKGGDQITGWMAWLGGDSIAVATGVSTIRVINLDPANWLRRLSGIVPRKIQP
jgi:WD40 repeat protein